MRASTPRGSRGFPGRAGVGEMPKRTQFWVKRRGVSAMRGYRRVSRWELVGGSQVMIARHFYASSRFMSDFSRRTFLGSTFAMTTLAAADYRIIDSHVHTSKHDPEFPFAPEANVPARDAAPETLLELMKANGISKTVIIQVIHYRYDNRFLAHVLKQYPRTFKGVCRVDPLDPAAPDHLAQLTEQGFSGVRLSPAGDATDRKST